MFFNWLLMRPSLLQLIYRAISVYLIRLPLKLRHIVHSHLTKWDKDFVLSRKDPLKKSLRSDIQCGTIQ